MNRFRNNFIFIILVGVSLLLLIGCGKNEETAEELMRYHNEDWTELSDKRKKALDDKQERLIFIETIEGRQASGEYLEEVVLPGLKEFIAEEKAIELEDESVKKLHQLLIEADEFAYKTLQDKGTAYYSGETDSDELFEANDDLKKKYDKFFDYREKLMEKNGLVIESRMNDRGSLDQIMMDKSEAKNEENTYRWGTE